MEVRLQLRADAARGVGALGLLLLVLAFPWLAPAARSQRKPARILFLHAFNYTFPATAAISEAARNRFSERAPHKIEIDAEFLDLARSSDPAHEDRMATFLRDKYARSPPDVIVTLGSLALPFIIKHRATIAPAVPVVFTSISVIRV